jgi:hypothetical protein
LRTYLRRWHFHAYFSGDLYIDVPEDTTEEAVREMVSQAHYGGNWKTDTLRRGEKVKVRKPKRKER